MSVKNKSGLLYVVATPIGNPKDITARAVETLASADAVICEEYREGSALLKQLNLQKELITLNEHNEAETASLIAQRILQHNQRLALISDCGTPVFADPGHRLLTVLTGYGIKITPVPGASSLMAALSVVNVPIDRFYFAGFIPRQKDERRKTLLSLRQHRVPVVLMDTPYRLVSLLQEVRQTWGEGAQGTLCIDLTLPRETILRGSIKEMIAQVGARKGEFVLILHGSRSAS